MELVEVGLRDEALLLDLLNTTPVMDGVQHDLLAEGPRGPGCGSMGRPKASWRIWSRPGMCFRPWCAEASRRTSSTRSSGRGITPDCDSRQVELGTGHRRRDARRGTGGLGVGRPADQQSRAPTCVCEPGLPAVPDRSQQAQHRTLVFDGHLREPNEGAQALPAREGDGVSGV